MLNTIMGLIRRFKVWHEVGNLRAELEQIKYWRDYAERRAPRIRKRLEELGHPLTSAEQNAEKTRRTIADRYPEIAEHLRLLEKEAAEEVRQETSKIFIWKGRA